MRQLCIHCGTPVPPDAESVQFCCRGCEAVHALLLEQGLGKYYELAGKQVTPVTVPAGDRSHSWLEPLVQQAEGAGAGLCSLQLDVQGIHCAACVWLMNETFRRRGGGAGITVNPALGSVRLVWRKEAAASPAFDVGAWVTEVERFGYQFGPARKQASRRSIDLPMRLGVSVALTLNVMLFSVSFYFGLSPKDPELFQLFTWLSCALSSGVVAVGGWPFFKAAVKGLQSGLLHLDLPIAAGIALVYGASIVQLRASGRGDFAYFDTLNTFITLMLTGRWLQERVLEKNRRYLLEDDGAEGITVRKVAGARLVSLRAPQIAAGDLLLIAPGDLVPVDGGLVEPHAQVSTDWITGEATPRQVEQGAELPAGSFNAGREAFHVIARTPFAQSPLSALLRAPQERPGHVPRHQLLWNRLAKSWVLAVLTLAAAGFLLWLPAGTDQAINVAVALLVITCPCAIGIALPLAYELTQSRLRRLGFFIRSADLLDRLTRVRKVLFDKTGTLTLGRLELVDRSALEGLDEAARDAAYNLAARSNHPVSRCVAHALEDRARYEPAAAVREIHGAGLELTSGDVTWRLGRADWALPGPSAGAPRPTLLTREERGARALVASIATREALRTDARAELASLQREHEVWLVSGDGAARVQATAQALGIDPSRALWAQTPEDKAALVSRLDREDTLFLGDGVNDALAFERALVAGTPAIDRPVIPGKSDFFLLGEGLSAIKEAIGRAGDLRIVVRRVLILSLSYNLFAVSLSLAGRMSPVTAAISMPVSTLALLLMTIGSLKAFDRARQRLASSAISPAREPALEAP